MPDSSEDAARGRILNAAFAEFTTRGYSDATTLEIARRAHVSKRELYALVGNKQTMLTQCIQRRAQRLALESDLPQPTNRAELERTLERFGRQFLGEVSDPSVIAIFRLAVAEAERAPEVARVLNSAGRQASRAVLIELLTAAQKSRIVDGDPAAIAEEFTALLWGDLLLSLLLRVAGPPTSKEAARRSRSATSAILRLYSVSTE